MRALALAAVLCASACYSTPQPACAFRCGPSGECPTNYMCVEEDGLCHLVVNGGPAECPQTTPTADAPIVEMPDAPLPTPDAPAPTPDAPVPVPDAPAPKPDAAKPDAPRPPDAPVADAPVADARLADGPPPG